MELEAAVRKRRSIRRYKPEKFPDELVKRALELALLAPNSSNVQNWNFHWVKSEEKKQKLVQYCLNQSAARTASHLIVASADTSAWRRSRGPLINWVKSVNAPKSVVLYYEKLIPVTYTAGWFNIFAPLKWLIFFAIGLFRPITRRPVTSRDLQEVSLKSSALACENFVLAITDAGGATCMMEGFDEWRVKKLLGLGCSSRVTMVIAVGYEAERGTWGPQFRLPYNEVVHEV